MEDEIFRMREARNIGLLNQCAVCEYERRPCGQNCVFRQPLPATRQGREDYARCVLKYGDDSLQYAAGQRHAIDSKINAARELFEESLDHPYHCIVMNLYSPFPGLRRYVAMEVVPRGLMEENEELMELLFGAGYQRPSRTGADPPLVPVPVPPVLDQETDQGSLLTTLTSVVFILVSVTVMCGFVGKRS